jgi:hypothetical protein
MNLCRNAAWTIRWIIQLLDAILARVLKAFLKSASDPG